MVSVMWLPEQLMSVADNVEDEEADEAGCKLMMSPMSSFHLIPVIAAPPHPYPCIEPMYVDMATLGVGMPTADDVVMATAATNHMAAVGMATTDGSMPLVGHCMMSIDDGTGINPLGWSSIYQCTDDCLATFDPDLPPTHITSGIHYDAHPIGGSDTHPIGGSTGAYVASSCALSVGAGVNAAASAQPMSKPAPAPCYNATSTLCTSDAANPCMTPVDSADHADASLSLIIGSGAFPLTQTRLRSSQDAANNDEDTAAGANANNDDDHIQDIEMTTASRPDVVSSNIPRSCTSSSSSSSSRTTANDHTCSSNAGSCSSVLHSHSVATSCTSSCSSNVGSCSSVLHSHPVATSCTSSCSSNVGSCSSVLHSHPVGTSCSGSCNTSVSSSDRSGILHQQLQQQDADGDDDDNDDDDDDDDDGDDDGELSDGAAPLIVDEQSDSHDLEPPSAADTEADINSSAD